MLRWTNTIIHGYHSTYGGSAAAIYGVAIHKYIDTMFKTAGDMRLSRDKMLESFRVPKYVPSKQQWIGDERHLLPVAFDVWDNVVAKDSTFQIIQIQSRCWFCNGTGTAQPEIKCEYCHGSGMRQQPATEVTFSVPFYEDDVCVITLEGTIDKIGKIKNGCYAIGDYKTTSQYKVDEYLADYEMSGQLRFYTLALRLMAEKYPESVLGQIGATKTGAFIDGIFLKAKSTDTEYKRSPVFIYTHEQIADYKALLLKYCRRLSAAAADVKDNLILEKEGILNGACKGEWGKCQYWKACASGSMYQQVMNTDFKKKQYDPLKHNER